MKKTTPKFYILAIVILLSAGNTAAAQEIVYPKLVCKTTEPNSTQVERVRISPDKKYLVVNFFIGKNNVAQFFDLSTCKFAMELKNEAFLNFTSDGKQINTAVLDNEGKTIGHNIRNYPDMEIVETIPYSFSSKFSFDMQYSLITSVTDGCINFYNYKDTTIIKKSKKILPTSSVGGGTVDLKSTEWNPKNHLVLVSWGIAPPSGIPEHLKYTTYGFLIYDMDKDSVIMKKERYSLDFTPLWCDSNRVGYNNDSSTTKHEIKIDNIFDGTSVARELSGNFLFTKDGEKMIIYGGKTMVVYDTKDLYKIRIINLGEMTVPTTPYIKTFFPDITNDLKTIAFRQDKTHFCLFQDSITSINEGKAIDAVLINNILKIEIHNFGNTLTATIADTMGATHYSKKVNIEDSQFELDVSFLPIGVYFITLTDDNNNSQTYKFVLE
jgi:hypothetical protein